MPISSPNTPIGSLTYSWEVTASGPNLSGFTTSSVGVLPISTPITGETIFNTNSVAEDLVYTLTPFFNGCPGNTQTFTITVDPTPEIFAMSETICSEDTFDVSPINGNPTVATIVPLGTTYSLPLLFQAVGDRLGAARIYPLLSQISLVSNAIVSGSWLGSPRESYSAFAPRSFRGHRRDTDLRCNRRR